MSVSRSRLRQQFKQQRAAMVDDARAAAIRAITTHLDVYVEACLDTHVNRANIAAGVTVGAFLATEDEVDLRPWIERYLGRGGRVALPRVGPAGSMEFHEYQQTTPLEFNRYGIAEPIAASPAVKAQAIDIMAIPLVAFDRSGMRLGMGGGYYDRYLVNLGPDAVMLGVAFACQESPAALPREPWDVPLHAVVTENGVLEFS